MINFNIKKIFFAVVFLLFYSEPALSSTKIEILYKVNDEIITSNDLENEKKFLLFLNSNLNKLSSERIEAISKNSILNRKIKEIELSKYFELYNDKNDKRKEAVNKFILNTNIT